MNKLWIIICFLMSLNCYADGPFDYIIMAEKGVDLLERPDIHSKIIKHLPYGTRVKTWFYQENPQNVKDTINGIASFWVMVMVNELNGYIFYPFLYHDNQWFELDSVIYDNTIRINREGFHLGDIDYNPQLKWYGIYMDSAGFYIKKININLILSKVEGAERFIELGCFENEGIFLETDAEDESLFILGTGKDWKAGRIHSDYFNPEPGFYEDHGFLYPERRFDFFYNRNRYFISAFDSLTTDNECNINREYQVEFKKIVHLDPNRDTVFTVNLNKDLNIFGTGEKHSEYKTPQLYWVGDINMDGLLDFIIYQHSMVNHGGVVWTWALFMSDGNSNEKPIYKADETYTSSCY